MGCTVEIISIGNELLSGKTLNTNAQWVAQRITRSGGDTRRILIVGDDLDEISQAIRGFLSRKPSFIITTGGLGPTFDDKTLKGISKALRKPLTLNKKALAMVKHAYEKACKRGILDKPMLTPPRLKMATLPRNAIPLPNPVGTAPGVLLKHGSTTLISLPGVPNEMKAMFNTNVMSLIKSAVGKRFIHELTLKVSGIMESDITLLIDKVMRKNPHVYIKSHPKTAEELSRIELHLLATAKKSKTAKNRVQKAAEEISQLIIKNGGKVVFSG